MVCTCHWYGSVLLSMFETCPGMVMICSSTDVQAQKEVGQGHAKV